jgi:hypothetical protein
MSCPAGGKKEKGYLGLVVQQDSVATCVVTVISNLRQV